MMFKITYKIYRWLHPIKLKGDNSKFCCKTKKTGHLVIDENGKNNIISIGDNVTIIDCHISINGSNNSVIINDNCRIYKLRLNIHGDKSKFEMKYNSGIREAKVIIQENRKVFIGENSMLSYGIHIRTSDSHAVYLQENSERINIAKDVIIGDNVWIAENASLLKGTIIGNNSIVGYGSICTKEYPEHCIIAGVPAKVIKNDINWSRSLK